MLALTAWESTRYIRGDDCGSSAGVPDRDQILFLLPDTSRAIVGCHSMSHRFPVRIRSSRHSMKDQTCELESSLTGKSFVVRREVVHVRLLDVQTM